MEKEKQIEPIFPKEVLINLNEASYLLDKLDRKLEKLSEKYNIKPDKVIEKLQEIAEKLKENETNEDSFPRSRYLGRNHKDN